MTSVFELLSSELLTSRLGSQNVRDDATCLLANVYVECNVFRDIRPAPARGRSDTEGTVTSVVEAC